MPPAREGVAVFIDLDNIDISAREAGKPAFIKVILDKAGDRGEIRSVTVFTAASGHSRSLARLRHACLERNLFLRVVHCEYFEKGEGKAKNLTDPRFIVEVMDALHRDDGIDVVVLATTDADFVPLLEKISASMVEGIVIGFYRNASDYMLRCCDRLGVRFYDLVRLTAIYTPLHFPAV